MGDSEFREDSKELKLRERVSISHTQKIHTARKTATRSLTRCRFQQCRPQLCYSAVCRFRAKERCSGSTPTWSNNVRAGVSVAFGPGSESGFVDCDKEKVSL